MVQCWQSVTEIKNKGKIPGAKCFRDFFYNPGTLIFCVSIYIIALLAFSYVDIDNAIYVTDEAKPPIMLITCHSATFVYTARITV